MAFWLYSEFRPLVCAWPALDCRIGLGEKPPIEPKFASFRQAVLEQRFFVRMRTPCTSRLKRRTIVQIDTLRANDIPGRTRISHDVLECPHAQETKHPVPPRLTPWYVVRTSRAGPYSFVSTVFGERIAGPFEREALSARAPPAARSPTWAARGKSWPAPVN